MRTLSILSIGLFWPSMAQAHVGHVGELAGHSHWIGLGAIVVAGVIAAAVGKLSSKEEPEAEDEEVLPEGEGVTNNG